MNAPGREAGHRLQTDHSAIKETRMAVVKPSSLAATLDAVNEAFFFDRPPAKAERRAAARWIAARQGLPGAYAGMFAPTAKDFASGLRLFSGECIGTRAGTSHILGEEACRALLLLDVDDAAPRDALKRASEGILTRLDEHFAENRGAGTYCCGKCSASLWRHLVAGGLNSRRKRLADGLAALGKHRDGKGRWRVFPFHYTLLALTEIGTPAARQEMRYAAPACERLVKRKAGGDKYDRRRRTLTERVLESC